MLLAVDTSTRVVGVALYDGISVLSEVAWISQNHHTVELGPEVSETFNRVGIESAALSAIGVAIGPGSFTGLRIGLALAKGLAFSRRIPIIGIPTLDALAAAQPLSGPLLAAVLEVGRSRLAVGWYFSDGNAWKPTGELRNISIDEFIERVQEPIQVCGELGSSLRRKLAEKGVDLNLASPAQSIRRPAFVAELAWKRWKKGDVDDPAWLKPVYLHHGAPIPG
jgi:tRNA threonylcarbamoyladenosine biosynthesis protein TsaB